MPPRHEPRCSGGVSEIGTLLWRLLEASTRLEMSKLLEDCLELGGASRNGGADVLYDVPLDADSEDESSGSGG